MTPENIIAEYQSALRAFLLSRMRNSADVDDVLQEALTKTFQNLHRLKAQDKIKPWLFQIARNAMMDHYRRQNREASVNPGDLWYDDPGEQERAFEGCVEPFLKALPVDTAELLRAVELQGASQKTCSVRHHAKQRQNRAGRARSQAEQGF